MHSVLSTLSSYCHGIGKYIYNNDDKSDWAVPSTKAIFEVSKKEDEPKKASRCSLKWIVRVLCCCGKADKTINTICLMTEGFNIHKMQKVVAKNDPFLAKEAFLPSLISRPFNFATHPATLDAIYKHHRDGGIFITDNGKDSIFQLITDMLDDPELKPDDLIFTCSPQMSSTYTRHLNKFFTKESVSEWQKDIHASIQDAILKWQKISNANNQVNISKQVPIMVCDIMCRLLLGVEDRNQHMSDAMATFFDYVIARFSRKSFDENTLNQARTNFKIYVYRAIEDRKGLAGALVEQGEFEKKQIFMIIFSYIFAGMDSTSTALTYGSFKIAQDLKLQNSLREELPPTNMRHELFCPLLEYSTLLNQFNCEVLRMCTPVIGVTRIARENLDFNADCMGKKAARDIQKGEVIFPSQNLIARCPFLFPDKPDTFIPSRHKEMQPLSSLAWRPFGGPKHSCPGMNLYDAIAKIYFAELIRSCRTSTDIVGEIEQIGSFINKLKEDVIVRIS